MSATLQVTAMLLLQHKYFLDLKRNQILCGGTKGEEQAQDTRSKAPGYGGKNMFDFSINVDLQEVAISYSLCKLHEV